MLNRSASQAFSKPCQVNLISKDANLVFSMYLYLILRHQTGLTEQHKPSWTAWGVQWLSGRVLDSRPRGRGFEPHQHHCVVSLSKYVNPSLALFQPRKTRLFITERLLMGRKESNQTNKDQTAPDGN